MGFLGFGSKGQKEVSRILRDLGALAEEMGDQRKALKEELAALEDLAIEPLHKWLQKAPKLGVPEWMFMDVFGALVAMGDEAALLTIAQFARSDPEERRCPALLALGMARNEAAIPVCVEAIGTDAERVVAAACTALKSIGSGAAVDELATILRDSSRPSKVRAAVASTVASLKGPKATKVLLEAAGDPQLGQVIPGCLGVLGPLVVPAIVEGLSSKNPVVRKVMVESLAAVGSIGGDEAVAGLAKALRDQDADVRSTAAQALQRVGQFGPLVAALKDDQFDNRFVMQALDHMGTRNKELLQAYANLLEAMGRRVTPGSMFAVEKLRQAEHLTAALRYLEEVTQYLPEDSEFMEPAIRLKREVRTALASRGRR